MMEEKTMLVWLLKHFRVESIRRRDQVRCKTELILRPIDGIPLRLVPRE